MLHFRPNALIGAGGYKFPIFLIIISDMLINQPYSIKNDRKPGFIAKNPNIPQFPGYNDSKVQYFRFFNRFY